MNLESSESNVTQKKGSCVMKLLQLWRDDKHRTTLLINAASILEKCDEQILPAVYNFVGASLNATPTQLGNITLGRAMVQALSSPVGGFSGTSGFESMLPTVLRVYRIVISPS